MWNSNLVANALYPCFGGRSTASLSFVACSKPWKWVLAAMALALAGCRNEMYDQPRYEPLEASRFFDDGSSARPLVEGVVPWAGNEEFVGRNEPSIRPLGSTRGLLATAPGQPVGRAVLQRGQERYRIFCVPCHGELGDGRGIIVQRGFSKPPEFWREDLLRAPLSHFVNVITHGHGAMYSYAARVSPADRFAIATYIRALQLSQHAALGQVTPEDRQKLEEVLREPAGR